MLSLIANSAITIEPTPVLASLIPLTFAVGIVCTAIPLVIISEQIASKREWVPWRSLGWTIIPAAFAVAGFTVAALGYVQLGEYTDAIGVVR